MQSFFKSVMRALARDQRGSSLAMYATVSTLLVITAGVSLDYAQVATLRAAMQAAADAASRAGATAYISSSSQAAANAVATSTFNTQISTLSANGIQNVTLGTVTVSNPSPGYQVQVVATATKALTALTVALPTSFTVRVTSTASNPNVDVTMTSSTTSGCRSDAGDHNILYYYKIPIGSSASWVPNPSGDLTGLTKICDNNTSSNPAVTLTGILATDQIGFALKNTTGGKSGYGSNGYGASQGTTHWFYSHIFSPSTTATDTSDKVCDKYGKNCTNPEHYPSNSNCSLQVLPLTSTGGQPTFPTGSCTSSLPQYAAPTCQQVNGQTLVYAWNDMGGGSDDKDYNDAMFQLTCGPSTGTTGSKTVGLTH